MCCKELTFLQNIFFNGSCKNMMTTLKILKKTRLGSVVMGLGESGLGAGAIGVAAHTISYSGASQICPSYFIAQTGVLSRVRGQMSFVLRRPTACSIPALHTSWPAATVLVRIRLLVTAN